jgi:hypothetical protein
MVGSSVDGAGEHGPYRWLNCSVAPLDDDGVTANHGEILENASGHAWTIV